MFINSGKCRLQPALTLLEMSNLDQTLGHEPVTNPEVNRYGKPELNLANALGEASDLACPFFINFNFDNTK